MYNFYITGSDVLIIIGIVLFFALVIFLQIRKKKQGKGKCSACVTASSCNCCNIKEVYTKSKNTTECEVNPKTDTLQKNG